MHAGDICAARPGCQPRVWESAGRDLCGSAGIHHLGSTLSNRLQPACCSRPNLNFKDLILNRFLPFSPCFTWIGQLVVVLLLFAIARGFVLCGDLGTYPSDIPMHVNKFGFPLPLGWKMCSSDLFVLACRLPECASEQPVEVPLVSDKRRSPPFLPGQEPKQTGSAAPEFGRL